MIKFVQGYLNEYYNIETSEVGNDGIYRKLDNNLWKIPFNSVTLISELSKIFFLNDKLLRELIITWATSNKADIDLEFYWLTSDGFVTIGNDLISVQPMNEPSSTILYMDYSSSSDTSVISNVYSDKVYSDKVYSDNVKTLSEYYNSKLIIEETFRQSWFYNKNKK